MVAIPVGGHPGIFLLIFQATGFQLSQLLHHMGHIHPLHHAANLFSTIICHFVPCVKVQNIRCDHIVAARSHIQGGR